MQRHINTEESNSDIVKTARTRHTESNMVKTVNSAV